MALHRITATCVVLFTAVLVAVGCGGSDGVAGGIVPKQAALVMTFDIRRDDGQWEQTTEVLERVPAWRLAEQRIPEPQRVVDQLLVAVGGKPSLDWEQEIEPWLGEEAGIAGWLQDAGASGDEGSSEEFDPRFVAWIETTDEDEARKAMRESVGDRGAGSFEGAELRRGTDRLADVYWTVDGERVLVGNAKGSVTAALRAAEAEGLEEGDAWERLQGDRGGDALVSFYGTDKVADQFEQLMTSLEGETDEATRKQLRQTADQLRGTAREFGYHLGADDAGVWIETVSVGSQDAAEPADDAPEARELVERLPGTTVLAAASRTGAVPDEAAAEAARTQLEQYEPLLANSPPLLRDLPQLMGQVLSPEYVEQSGEAYRGDLSFGITVAEGDEMSFVGTYGVEDEDAALELDASVWTAIGTYVEKRSDLRVQRAPTADGSTVTVSGIPAQRGVVLTANALGATPAQVREHPLGARFLQPTLTYEQRTTEQGEQVFAFPGDAIAGVEDSVGGESTLAEAGRYEQALKAADVPEDIESFFWMDLRDLLRPIIEPSEGEAWALARNQLDHVGGPIGWSQAEQDGDDTIRRSMTRVLLYE